MENPTKFSVFDLRNHKWMIVMCRKALLEKIPIAPLKFGMLQL